MKLTVRLTMEGLIRALKGRAHDLAEALEQGQARQRRAKPVRRRAGQRGGAHGIRRG